MEKPLIGLMLGDVTGIGPEISARLLASGVAHEGTAYDIVGQGRADPGALEHAFTLAAKLAANLKRVPGAA